MITDNRADPAGRDRLGRRSKVGAYDLEMPSYSVLMSVYAKEQPEYLRQSMESMFTQTVPTDDFVLVCDGPLTDELDKVIADMQKRHMDRLKVVRLPENRGLGNALNEGLKVCRHDLVARMDSDDISFPDRCERELAVFSEHPEISILSGTVLEFSDTTDTITGKRELPQTHDKICRFSQKRNPFNHPAVMFRRQAVEAAGGYQSKYYLFEDYYLWIRVLQSGAVAANLKEPVLYMRVTQGLYARRGGKEYAKNMLAFRRWMRQSGWSGSVSFLIGSYAHALVCILPNSMRGKLYQWLHK